MPSVECKLCGQSLDSTLTYCVIDTRTRERWYECADPCKAPAAPLEVIRPVSPMGQPSHPVAEPGWIWSLTTAARAALYSFHGYKLVKAD